MVLFHHLGEEELKSIVHLQLKEVGERMARQGLRLTVTDGALKWLVVEGFDRAFGARPLKRVIQNRILDDLSLRIIEGEFKEGDEVVVDSDGEGFVITKGVSSVPGIGAQPDAPSSPKSKRAKG